MARFEINTPVVQPDPEIVVDVDAENPLPPGRHRFGLIVTDDSGNTSTLDAIEVLIRDTAAPTAVIDVVDANKLRIAPVVDAGKSFTLSGAQSFDIGRSLASYSFVRLD